MPEPEYPIKSDIQNLLLPDYNSGIIYNLRDFCFYIM